MHAPQRHMRSARACCCLPRPQWLVTCHSRPTWAWLSHVLLVTLPHLPEPSHRLFTPITVSLYSAYLTVAKHGHPSRHSVVSLGNALPAFEVVCYRVLSWVTQTHTPPPPPHAHIQHTVAVTSTRQPHQSRQRRHHLGRLPLAHVDLTTH